MLEAIGKISKQDAHGAIIYVPSKICCDSLFPFSFPNRVKIRVDGSRLIIEPIQ